MCSFWGEEYLGYSLHNAFAFGCVGVFPLLYYVDFVCQFSGACRTVLISMCLFELVIRKFGNSSYACCNSVWTTIDNCNEVIFFMKVLVCWKF